MNSRDQRETVQGPSEDTQPDAGSETNNGIERNPVVFSSPQEPVEQLTERSHTTVTTHGVQPRFVALRTVPVFLKNGHRRIKVNSLLDEASTKTYLNADVAAELELQGEPQKVTVNVLNGQTQTFETTPVEFELESMNGNVATKMSAFRACWQMVPSETNTVSRSWQTPKSGLVNRSRLRGVTLLIQGCSRPARRTSCQAYTIRMDLYWNY